MNKLTIHFDGGCRPTNPGNKYGSYEVLVNDNPIHKVSVLELGPGTNNEAEFDILIVALDWTLQALEAFGNDPNVFNLNVYTDSMVVFNRLLGRNRKAASEPQRRMSALTHQCLIRAVKFKSFTPHWNGREKNLTRFGH